MNETSVIAENLSKKFKKTLALDSLTFTIGKGELFGFIGPDGAGKTTLFRILTTLLLPTTGKASVEGFDTVKDYRKLRNILGYMPGRFSLYQDLSVEENLNFFATAFGVRVSENYHLIKDIYSQIEPFKKRRAGALSGGMKQKLALSCALIHKPVVLILDEPTTGVDAVSRREFWEMLKRLKNEGITILVSTPYMDEASLCDRVALIQESHILQIDTPDEIIKGFNKELFEAKADNMFELLHFLENSDQINSAYPFGEYLHFIPSQAGTDIALLESEISNGGIAGISIRTASANIEDCFIELMKGKK